MLMAEAEDAIAAPHILLFDSGLGGLTVLREVARARPDARLTYLADDALFPYGALAVDVLVGRVVALMDEHVAALRPDLVVIACNTASTLVLPPLRARFAIPFVGTVPAVKTGATRSRTGLFSVLATPGTVGRDYTRALIAEHAGGCAVTLVGSSRLAQLAEDMLRQGHVDEGAVRHEILPAFVERGERRTDAIVLACTHYPLLIETFRTLAPWPVEWIDPAPAIGRRVADLLAEWPVRPTKGVLKPIFTSGCLSEALAVISHE